MKGSQQKLGSFDLAVPAIGYAHNRAFTEIDKINVAGMV